MSIRALIPCFAAALLAFGLVGCSADEGGAAKGPADDHCKGKKPQPTSLKVCHMSGNADPADYGDPMYGDEGDDDDCKYHVTWTSTDIVETVNVSFTMKVVSLTDGKPVTGSESYMESFIGNHPSPNTNPAMSASEDPKGTYTIGPVLFDEKGKWTVRFHIYEQCTDVSDESPHGHAAFYIDVP
jgi:hypothetical protein